MPKIIIIFLKIKIKIKIYPKTGPKVKLKNGFQTAGHKYNNR
jgi:hypothetical protein